jgi:hypothetical protein
MARFCDTFVHCQVRLQEDLYEVFAEPWAMLGLLCALEGKLHASARFDARANAINENLACMATVV